jgi:asparagine synthase (glutamine-hydrolysing)
MCGIVGFAARPGEGVDAQAKSVGDALQSLRHRGPDLQDGWGDGRVWLGHARLSIIDLSPLGSQPMHTPEQRHVIAYNGEVYNFRELAASLTGLRSSSDTEVVLRLAAEQGPRAFASFNGMFAFALLDRTAKKLWLVRDRLGIKPLFYSVDSRGLAFASEIKAIHAMRGSRPVCEVAALHEWLYYGNPHGERTLHAGIRQLLPGHYLELDLETFAITTRAYWSLAEQAGAPRTAADVPSAIARTRELLEEAVRRQLVADVPVGLFLSGGVDSSALAAFAVRHYPGKLATYCAGFDFQEGAGDLPRAREVAKLFGTDHHEIHIAGANVAEVVEKLVWNHDMPFADAANIPLALLAGRISSHTRVVLQGDGGDELFCGYSRYFTLARRRLLRAGAWAFLPLLGLTPRNALHYRARRFLRAVSESQLANAMALLLTSEDRSLVPEKVLGPALRAAVDRFDPFARHREALAPFLGQDPVNQMSFVDLLVTLPDKFLEKVDRATMSASLEVRVPFLDHDLVDFVVGLPGDFKAPQGRRKWLLKQALSGTVPDSVLYAPKAGLDVPYGRWLQGALAPLFFDHLARFETRNPGLLDATELRRLHAATGAGGKDDSFMLWKMLNFMIWANNSDVEFRV